MSGNLFKEKVEQKVRLKEVCSDCGKAKASDSNATESETCRCETRAATSTNALTVTDAPVKTLEKQSGKEFPIDLGEQYQVLELIGQGGMGTVYRVRDKTLNKDFAVKVLRDELATDDSAIKRFEQEANSASELTHANMLAVYNHGKTTAGSHFIVMDLLEGESLSQILKREGKLDAARTINISAQICDALAHAHMKGLVHRDLKPSNIMLTNSGNVSDVVKVLDFGIAKLMPSTNRDTQNLTKTGELFGSPSYMSPEQCLGCSQDARSDIYSLGCMMYEMLTGKPPFFGKNPIQTVIKHLNEVPQPINKIAPGAKIPAGLEAIIMRCLDKDTDARYQSMDHLRADLQMVSAGQVPKQPKKQVGKSARNSWGKIALISFGTWCFIGASHALLFPFFVSLICSAFIGKALLAQIQKQRAEKLSALGFWKTSTLASVFAMLVCAAIMTGVTSINIMHVQLPAELVLTMGSSLAIIIFQVASIFSAIAWGISRAISSLKLSSRDTKALNASMLMACLLLLVLSRPQLAYIPYAIASTANAIQIGNEKDPRRWKDIKPSPLLDVAIFLNPNFVEAYYARGAKLISSDPKRALEDLTKIIELNPERKWYSHVDTPEALGLRAQVYSNLGKYQEALTDLNRAISLDPENSLLYGQRARCYEKMHEYQKAIASYSDEIAKNASASWAYAKRARLQERLGNNQAALADYSAAIELDSEPYKLYAQRAALYKKLGNKFKAIKDYESITDVRIFSKGITEKDLLGEREYYQGMAFTELGDKKHAKFWLEAAAHDGYKPPTVQEEDD